MMMKCLHMKETMSLFIRRGRSRRLSAAHREGGRPVRRAAVDELGVDPTVRVQMKLNKRCVGLLAFLIVLFTMPVGHAVMIVMEKGLGHEHVYTAAVLMGLVGLFLLVFGFLSSNDTLATFLGFFAGLFIWTGWVEFSFVYFANRYGVPPLIVDGVVATKPEYLLMPSSLPFLVVFLIHYFFGTKSGCSFFNWFQRKLKTANIVEYKAVPRNPALTTMMELVMVLWTFYLVLLFSYDERFFGDRHLVTYLVAFGSLFCSVYLFMRLLRIKELGFAIRYAIPTVVIFWNFVEILGRWGLFQEIWVEPHKYRLEMTLTAISLVGLVVIGLLESRRMQPKST
jgi:hypothetical protein